MPARLPHLLPRLSAPLLGWLLPATCALCGMHAHSLLCAACSASLHDARARCPVCALPLPPQAAPQQPCGACLARPPRFANTIAACDYALPQDRLVLALKFGRQTGLGPHLAHQLRDAILRQQPHTLPDLLCPVPLSRERLAERGYNQALEIARPLAQWLGVPLEPRLCLRVRDTAAQSGLSLRARSANLRRAFLPHPAHLARLPGLHVGVVDDVMTSSRTLNEMARMLRRHGVVRVSNYVFARTPPPA